MRRVVVSGMIGNGLEWYDFALFGAFTSIIGRQFFPSSDPFAQLMLTYGVFAAGFFMRPLGAVVFGYIGDKYGRKISLTISILLMAVPTGCIGLLPNYEAIGMWAPILLTVIRLCQGMSLGGEFSGSITFVVEHAPRGRRGLAGSSTIFSLCAGILLGLLAATLVHKLLPPDEVERWGWRVPFVLGVGIAFVGFYIRHKTDESPHYEKSKASGALSPTPLRDVLKYHLSDVVRGVGIYLSVTVPFYVLTVFMKDLSSKFFGHSEQDALFISTMCTVLLMVMVPFTGWLSDRVGRKRLMVTVAVAYLIVTYPVFYLLIEGDFWTLLLIQLAFALVVAFYIGPAPTVFVELFPTRVRYTGMALSYNISAALFGGTAPMVSTWLITATGLKTAVAFYIMLCAVLSILAFRGYHDRYKEELD